MDQWIFKFKSLNVVLPRRINMENFISCDTITDTER